MCCSTLLELFAVCGIAVLHIHVRDGFHSLMQLAIHVTPNVCAGGNNGINKYYPAGSIYIALDVLKKHVDGEVALVINNFVV